MLSMLCRHYTTKLEKQADESDDQKVLRTHEKLLVAADDLTSATNEVYEAFNLFDDYRRKLVFDQTPKMFAAQRQLLHDVRATSEIKMHVYPGVLTCDDAFHTITFPCSMTPSCWRRWIAWI